MPSPFDMYRAKQKRAVNPDIPRPNLFSHEKKIKDATATIEQLEQQVKALQARVAQLESKANNQSAYLSQLHNYVNRAK